MKSMKRIVNKVGYVYCAEIDDLYKVYFQYIAKDSTQLYSEVLRFFATKYPINEMPSIDSIVNDKVSFYTHTYELTEGIKEGLWHKVGKHEELGDIEHICFRCCQDFSHNIETPDYQWFMWEINKKEFIDIGPQLTNDQANIDIGSVYPADYILEKVKTGRYSDENVLIKKVQSVIDKGYIDTKEDYEYIKMAIIFLAGDELKKTKEELLALLSEFKKTRQL